MNKTPETDSLLTVSDVQKSLEFYQKPGFESET